MSDATFASTITDFDTDISHLKASIDDALTMGNAVAASTGYNSGVTSHVAAQNEEFKKKKMALQQEIDAKEALIQRSNRDFADVKERLPESLPKKTVNVLEDYTMAVLLMSYLFMVCAFLYFYVMISPEWTTALLRGSGYAVVGSLLFWMVMYYLC